MSHLSLADTSESASTRGHWSEPVVSATGVQLDMTRGDLGHSEDPGLWSRLHGHCIIGPPATLYCAHPRCGEPLYLREQDGKRRAYHYSPADLAAAGYESDVHHALKDVVCEYSLKVGLTPDLESTGPGGKRRTDVLVTGGVRDVGWEIQLARLGTTTLKKRLTLAESDGLVSSWITRKDSQVDQLLNNRVPSVRTTSMTALEYITAPDLPIIGVQTLSEPFKCTRQFMTRSWHIGRPCSGVHVRPGGPRPQRLLGMIEQTADESLIAVSWPWPLVGIVGARIWLTREDARRLRDIEASFIGLDGVPTEPTPIVRPVVLPTWHEERTTSEPVSGPIDTTPYSLRPKPPVIGTSSAGWSNGTAAHQLCACGQPAPPRRDGRKRVCVGCTSKGVSPDAYPVNQA